MKTKEQLCEEIQKQMSTAFYRSLDGTTLCSGLHTDNVLFLGHSMKEAEHTAGYPLKILDRAKEPETRLYSNTGGEPDPELTVVLVGYRGID